MSPIGEVFKKANLNPKTNVDQTPEKICRKTFKTSEKKPVSIRKGDRISQLVEIQENNMNWTQTGCFKTLGQRSAKNLVRGTSTNPSVGIEPTDIIPQSILPSTITVLGSRKRASKMALQYIKTLLELSF